jgi:hypothetical protein
VVSHVAVLPAGPPVQSLFPQQADSARHAPPVVHWCIFPGQLMPHWPAVQVAVPPIGAGQSAAVQQLPAMQAVPHSLNPELQLILQVPPGQVAVPFVGAAHRVLQHTPDTQLPLVHMPPIVHWPPGGNFWHVMLTQLSLSAVSQSAAVDEQLVLHL